LLCYAGAKFVMRNGFPYAEVMGDEERMKKINGKCVDKKFIDGSTQICLCDTNLCNTQPFKDGYLAESSATRRMMSVEAVVSAAVLAFAITMSVNGGGILEL